MVSGREALTNPMLPTLMTLGQDLPLSEQLGARLFCPALHPLMSEADNEFVAAALDAAVQRVAREG